MTSNGNPGEDYQYNGDRYSLLSSVIEGATGRSFQALLAERILEPLGLRHTVPSRKGLAGFEGYDASLVYEELADPYTGQKPDGGRRHDGSERGPVKETGRPARPGPVRPRG